MPGSCPPLLTAAEVGEDSGQSDKDDAQKEIDRLQAFLQVCMQNEPESEYTQGIAAKLVIAKLNRKMVEQLQRLNFKD